MKVGKHKSEFHFTAGMINIKGKLKEGPNPYADLYKASTVISGHADVRHQCFYVKMSA